MKHAVIICILLIGLTSSFLAQDVSATSPLRTDPYPRNLRSFGPLEFAGASDYLDTVALGDSMVVAGSRRNIDGDDHLYLRIGTVDGTLIAYEDEVYAGELGHIAGFSMQAVDDHHFAVLQELYSYSGVALRIYEVDHATKTMTLQMTELVYLNFDIFSPMYLNLCYLSGGRFVASITDSSGPTLIRVVDVNLVNYTAIVQPVHQQNEYRQMLKATPVSPDCFLLCWLEDISGLITMFGAVGTISGSTISLGTPYQLSTPGTTIRSAAVALSPTRVAYAYNDNATNDLYGCFLNIQGDVISHGQSQMLGHASNRDYTISALSDSQVLVCFGDFYGKVCAVGDSVLIPGELEQLNAGNSAYSIIQASIAVLSEDKVVICCSNRTDTSYSFVGEIHDGMSVIGRTVTQNTDDVLVGSQKQQVIGVNIKTIGYENPISLTTLHTDTYGIHEDLSNMRIYYTGADSIYSPVNQFGDTWLEVDVYEHYTHGYQVLSEGDNYFWVTYDVSEQADTYTLDAVSHYLGFDNSTVYDFFTNGSPDGNRQIVAFDTAPVYRLMLDGADDIIEVNDLAAFAVDEEFTICAWIRPTDGANRQAVFSTRATDQPGGIQLEIGPADGGASKLAVSGSGSWVAVSQNGAITPGEWNHVACVRSGSAVGQTKLFVNGIEIALETQADYTVNINSDPVRIGSGVMGQQVLHGEIDEVSFWSRALSNNELREMVHRCFRGYEDGLTARWQFNEGTGACVVEHTEGHNATLTGFSGDAWGVSTIPMQYGQADSDVEQDGIVTFPNCWMDMLYSQQTGADVTVSMLNNPPNLYPSVGQPFEVVGSRHWVLQRDGTGAFAGQPIFWMDEDIQLMGLHTTSLYKLFHRSVISDSSWSFVSTAMGVDLNLDVIHFPSITQTGQYMVCRIPWPEPVSYKPAQNAVNAPWGGVVQLTFPAPMHAGIGDVRLYEQATNVLTAVVPADSVRCMSNEVFIDCDMTLANETTYRVEVDAGAVLDPFGVSWPRTAESWLFTTGAYEPEPGHCISFDGVDDFVNLQHSPLMDLTDGITIECWVKPDAHEDWAPIVISPAGYEGKFALSLGGFEGSIGACYSVDDEMTVNRRSLNPTITVGQWNHVAFTATDDGIANIYINGQWAECTAEASYTFTGEDIYLGASQNDTAYFQGAVDELRIWDYPRTQQEIAQGICTPIDPQSSGIACYLQMNEGDGGIARDMLGGNDGTLMNMSRSGWGSSTIPYGVGQYELCEIDGTGTYMLPQTSLMFDVTAFTPVNDDTLVVLSNCLQASPNTLPQPVDDVFDSQYWVVSDGGEALFETEATFFVAEDITANDQANPETLALYQRDMGSDEDWTLHSRASFACSDDSSVTFSGLTELSQFIIARNTNFPSPDGIPGYCIDFDGVDDYVELANEQAYDFADQFTVECWFNPTPTGDVSMHTLLAKDWYISLNLDPLMSTVSFSGSFCDLAEYTMYDDSLRNQWSHLAVTYSFSDTEWTGTLSMYLNGELVANSVGWDVAPNSSLPVLLGKDQTSSPNHFDGAMDQVRFWSVCRSQEDIREHMYSPVLGIEQGLAATFQLNEGIGVATVDIVSGLQGAMVNMDASNWMLSTIPYGAGMTVSAIEAPGVVNFSGTGLQLDYTAQNGDDVIAARIDLSPNELPTTAFPAFDGQYWVLDKYGDAAFEADMTLTLAEDLTAEDASDPSCIKLFSRDCNAEGDWRYVTDAVNIDATNNEATFSGITGSGQYIVGKRSGPEAFAGDCLHLDGMDDYIDCGVDSSLCVFDELTLEAWIKTTDSNLDQKILGKFDDWNNFFILGIGAGHHYSQVVVNGNSVNFYAGEVISGEWTHLALSYAKGDSVANGTCCAYINGELVYSQNDIIDTPVDVVNSAFPFRIGVAPWDTNAFHFSGELDEVRIWSRQLSETEIREGMYLSLNGDENELAAYWQMNEGAGLYLQDKALLNDGDLMNIIGSAWVASTLPFGPGASFSAVEAAGTTDFTDTGLSMAFQAVHGAAITVTRIDTTANVNPIEPDDLLAPPYWVVNRFGIGDFNADLTFTTDGLSIDDLNNPEQIALFSRASNADDVWVFLATAAAVDSSLQTATFEGVGDIGQYVITRWVQSINPPQNMAIRIVDGAVEISWDASPGVDSYIVFAADTLDGVFSDVTASGTITTDARSMLGSVSFGRSDAQTSSRSTTRRSRVVWTTDMPTYWRYFYVTSVAEPAR